MTEFCDFVTNKEGLYAIPTLLPFIERHTLTMFSRLVERHEKGEIVLAKFAKHPKLIEEWKKAAKLLASLPNTYSGQEYRWRNQHGFGTYVCGKFITRLNNKLSDTRQKGTRLSTDWQWELAETFQQTCPHLPEMFRALSKEAETHHPYEKCLASVGHYHAFLNQYEHLKNGEWTIRLASHDDQLVRKMEGVGFAVYFNDQKCYMSSSGKSTECLSGAKIYESLEAAKRSIKAMGVSSQSLSYIEVAMRMERIAEHTGQVDLSLREAHGLRQKQQLMQSVLDHQHPTQEQLKNPVGRKPKM